MHIQIQIKDSQTKQFKKHCQVANIDDATSSVDVEVMDYYPFSMFFAKNFYWDNIDAALRRAAFRGVQVRLLFG